MNINKIAPWNWFKKEEAGTRAMVPVNRNGDTQMSTFPIAEMHRAMDRMFDDFFRDFGLAMPRWPRNLTADSETTWLKPNLDISATDNEYSIAVELPGVSEKDVQVDVSGDTLSIRGEKRQESEHKGRDYHTVERSYGSFQRTLALPDDADRDGIDAKFKRGLLTVTIPRNASVQTATKQIDVKTN